MNRKHIAALLIIIFAFAVSSCADKTITETNPERPTYKPSPTEVTESFLKALKEGNFGKAFDYAYVPSSDKEGYIIRMSNIYKDNQIKVNSYRILGTQIFGLSATVVVELDTTFKSPSTGKLVTLVQKSKYSLGLFDKKWKVTSDSCFENCLEEVPEIEIAD
jgi:hypothetical protein